MAILWNCPARGCRSGQSVPKGSQMLAKPILNKMKHRKQFNSYLDDLENRLDDAQAAELYRHLPGVIDILLAGPLRLQGRFPPAQDLASLTLDVLLQAPVVR
jgi:hypothetical protein